CNCSICPGPLDLRFRVSDRVAAASLRFWNLSPEGRKRLSIKGHAQWQKDGSLALAKGETRIRGLIRSGKEGPLADIWLTLPKQTGDSQSRSPIARAVQAQGAGSSNAGTLVSVASVSRQELLEQTSTVLTLRPCHTPAGDGCPPARIAAANTPANRITLYPLSA